MLYLFQKPNKNLLIVFMGLLLLIGSPQGWTSDINDPEHIMDIWTKNGKSGPESNTINAKIQKVRETFQEKYNQNKPYDNQSKGVIAEAASVALFEVNGWQPWDKGNCNLGKCFGDKIGGYVQDVQDAHLNGFKGKGKDNGIDGLFTKIIKNDYYLIINESKFRSGNRVNLLKNDFGMLADNTRQSSSEWNKKHLQNLGFTGVQVNSATFNGTNYLLVRSGTFLNHTRDFKLYFISDLNNNHMTNKEILADFVDKIPNAKNFSDKVKQAIDYIKS